VARHTVYSVTTETKETFMSLSAVEERFILHWGEMGTKWGINRTVAQIHALLYLSPKPLNAEDISTTLSVARSNVSNSLHELQGWGIVKVVHVLGDRRDHFESLKDVWEMFQIILDERKSREVDPTLSLLRELNEAKSTYSSGDVYAAERIEEVLELLELMTKWYGYVRVLPRPGLKLFIKAGAKIQKAFGGFK
jgi:DNA-binding transcriptional regulator GbsR (MarR family)